MDTVERTRFDNTLARTAVDQHMLASGDRIGAKLPIVHLNLKAHFRYQFISASDGSAEIDPVMYVYMSHGMSDLHTIKLSSDMVKQHFSLIPIELVLEHRGPFPADAAIHFVLFVHRYHAKLSQSGDTEAHVAQRVGAGMIMLSDVFKVMHEDSIKDKSVAAQLVHTPNHSQKRGDIVLSLIEDKGDVLYCDKATARRLEQYWKTCSADRLNHPWKRFFDIETKYDYTYDNIPDFVRVASKYIEVTDYALYLDSVARKYGKPHAAFKHTVDLARLVKMPTWLTPFSILPALAYMTAPPSLRMRGRRAWLNTMAFYRNMLRISLDRSNVSRAELIAILNEQLSPRATRIYPRTRHAEMVLKEFVSAIATHLPYTGDSVYSYNPKTKKWALLSVEDFGDGYLRGTEDCEGLARMMLGTLLAIQTPYFTDEALSVLGAFSNLYVPEMTLSIVDSASLDGSSTGEARLGKGKPMLENTPAEENKRTEGAGAHMFMTLTPYVIHRDRITRLNGKSPESELSDETRRQFYDRHVRSWSSDLQVLACEGTGHLERVIPETVVALRDGLGEQARKAIADRLDARAKMNAEIVQTIPLLSYLGSPQFMQNRHHAVNSYQDRKYTPFSPFYGFVATVFTPFWVQYGIPAHKFEAGLLSGGVHRHTDPGFRCTVPAEQMFLADEDIAYFTYPLVDEQMQQMIESCLNHEVPTPMPTLVNRQVAPYCMGDQSRIGTPVKMEIPESISRVTMGDTVQVEQLPREVRPSADSIKLTRAMSGSMPTGEPRDMHTEHNQYACSELEYLFSKSLTEQSHADVQKTIEHEQEVCNTLIRSMKTFASLPADTFHITSLKHLRQTDMRNSQWESGAHAGTGSGTMRMDHTHRGEVTRLFKTHEKIADHAVGNPMSHANVYLNDNELISRDSPRLANGSPPSCVVYGLMAPKKLRAIPAVTFWIYETHFSEQLWQQLINAVASSQLIEGVQIVPEVFQLDPNHKPLNAQFRITLYHYPL